MISTSSANTHKIFRFLPTSYLWLSHHKVHKLYLLYLCNSYINSALACFCKVERLSPSSNPQAHHESPMPTDTSSSTTVCRSLHRTIQSLQSLHPLPPLYHSSNTLPLYLSMPLRCIQFLFLSTSAYLHNQWCWHLPNFVHAHSWNTQNAPCILFSYL